MTTIWLGNHAAVDHVPTGRTDDRGEPVRTRTPLDGKHCTRVDIPDGMPIAELITTLTHGNGVWSHHSNAPAPAWVAATDPGLAHMLGEVWGCEVREPEA